MGLYTNPSFYNGYTSSDYTSVEPFKGEHFNYHELGIIAATESAANRDAFMKAIALNELASVEQYGTDQVFYESVNIKGVFDRIKAFFKKIIEKIHKIFHTFIAKLGSWFQSSKDFAKKYEKDIIKNWGQVKNDWEFKGYKFNEKLLKTKAASEGAVNKIKTNKGEADKIISLLKATDNASTFGQLLSGMSKSAETGSDDLKSIPDGTYKVIKQDDTEVNVEKKGNSYHDTSSSLAIAHDKIKTVKDSNGNILFPKSGKNSLESVGDGTNGTKTIAKFREEFNEKGKDQIRYQIVQGLIDGELVTELNCDFDSQGSYDAKEFTEELHKVIYGEDDKEDLSKSDIEKMYGGSMTSMITFLKEYDKIKSDLEKSERTVVKSIDGIINAIDSAQSNIIKDKDDSHKAANEFVVQVSTVFQSFWGFVKECETQAFAAYLSGVKDACSQAKQIAVKVIGLSKKMTEESVDYSNYYGDNNFNSFIENVKLV